MNAVLEEEAMVTMAEGMEILDMEAVFGATIQRIGALVLGELVKWNI